MMPGPLFAIALIIMDVGAALAYAWQGDIRRSVYWLAAAVLTMCVTA
jgi:hypothetical protein